MAKKKAKKANTQSAKKAQKLTWNSLKLERDNLINMIVDQDKFVNELVKEELTPEELSNPENATVKEFNGLASTYIDLLKRTIEISKEHGTVEEVKEIEGIQVPQIKFQEGEVNTDDVNELMKYQCIMNKYGEVAFSLSNISTGAMSQFVIGITENKARREGLGTSDEAKKEIDDLKTKVDGFKAIMDNYGIDNVHELVPKPEDIKKQYEDAVKETEKAIEAEKADIESKSKKEGDENGK